MIPVRQRAALAVDLVHSRRAARRFDALLTSVRPDLIHLHNPSRQLSPSILRVAARHTVPVVLTLHDYALICPQGQLFKGERAACTPPNCVRGNVIHAVSNRCIKGSTLLSVVGAIEHGAHRVSHAYGGHVAAMIAPSRYMVEMVRSTGVTDRPIHLIPNGIADVARMAAPSAGGHILFLGRLAREKGLDVLIRAAATVPDVQIVVAGDGPLRDDLESSSGSNVHFVGACQPDRLTELMAAAVAVVSPSVWYENAPLSIIEALRGGRPVIASDIGGQPELVDDRNGLLVPPGDADSLGAAMGQLWADRGRADAMGASARQRYLDAYTLDAHLRRLLAVYADVLGSAGSISASSTR